MKGRRSRGIVAVEWDEAEPVGEDLVDDDGGVIPDVDVLYCDGGDLGRVRDVYR